MRGKGGPHKSKDKEGRGYVTEKIRKELEELDEKYIEEELEEYEKKKNGIS